MRITPARNLGRSYFQRITRRGGGVSLGLSIHFPVSIWDGVCEGDASTYDGHVPTNTTYRSIYVRVGLVFWEFSFYIDYNHKPIEEET